MESAYLKGPYRLKATIIDRLVRSGRVGNYVLGRMSGKELGINYVGRSDTCLRERLKRWEGDERFTHFMFHYTGSVEDAYVIECIDYHDINPTENDIHPARPEGLKIKCPVCGR